MNKARNIDAQMRFQATRLSIEMGDWVHSLAPWQVISHMTFAWEASVWSAQRCYEKFMKRELWGVSYFHLRSREPGVGRSRKRERLPLRCPCRGVAVVGNLFDGVGVYWECSAVSLPW